MLQGEGLLFLSLELPMKFYASPTKESLRFIISVFRREIVLIDKSPLSN
jgi:hypothetical protein